jgi:hypothetical protein
MHKKIRHKDSGFFIILQMLSINVEAPKYQQLS